MTLREYVQMELFFETEVKDAVFEDVKQRNPYLIEEIKKTVAML